MGFVHEASFLAELSLSEEIVFDQVFGSKLYRCYNLMPERAPDRGGGRQVKGEI
jgi:hypothetical protein